MQLFLTAGFILLIVVWGVLAPDTMATQFDMLLAGITRNFGWLYLWLILGLVLMALFLALSRYGDLRLGGDDEQPQFSTASWFSMLFAAGMGIGLVFWGVAEPISHFNVAPPPGIKAGTPEAAMRLFSSVSPSRPKYWNGLPMNPPMSVPKVPE